MSGVMRMTLLERNLVWQPGSCVDIDLAARLIRLYPVSIREDRLEYAVHAR
jgi:hypothetical protein